MSVSGLAPAFARYIDPTTPEFDPAFAAATMKRHPGWFTMDEITAINHAINSKLYTLTAPGVDEDGRIALRQRKG